MLVKTNGIAIKNTKYGETSLISKIYTRQYGMQAFIINGVHSPKAAIKPSLLQPVTLLEMVIYLNSTKNLQRIKELKVYPHLQNIHFDIVKSSIAMFMAEVIYKTVKEEEANEGLYDFLAGFLLNLDHLKEGVAVAPLQFLLRLSAFLGFYPQNNFSHAEGHFSLTEGSFKASPGSSEEVIGSDHSQAFSDLLKNNNEIIRLSRPVRSDLLKNMITYYRIHLPEFTDLKSLPVLQSVLHDA